MITGKKCIILILVISCVLNSFSYNSDYEAAVPTLNLPLGAREISMGDVGITTARPEVGSYWNPALMGVRDVRLQNGIAYYQFGQPHQYGIVELSNAELLDDQNQTGSLSYQFPGSYAGGFNFSVNNNHFRVLSSGFSNDFTETIYSLTWGFGFQKIGLENHTFGVTAKYIRSVIPPLWWDQEKKRVGRDFALDLGYLWKICSRFSAGLHFANMGPRIYYVSRWQMDPLPFKGELGIGFHDSTIVAIVPLTISAEYKVSRFFVRYGYVPDRFFRAITTSWTKNSNEENWRSILHNFGYEITLYNHLHLRQGFFIDPRYDMGEKEMHWGFGGTFLNHFSIDFYHIYSPKATPKKHGAWGLTGTFFNIGKWSNR